MTAMRTFVYRDAKSHKFWNVGLEGRSLTVTYGKVGTEGRSQTRSFPDEAKAKREHDRLVAQKLRKGYAETTPAAAPGSLREALESALAANPDDASGVLKRLKVLDLRHGHVTDKGARLLASCPDARGLEVLDLINNRLTRSGVVALRRARIPVRAERQQGRPYRDDRILYYGDSE